MKRIKPIFSKMWTSMKSAGRHVWEYLKSKEGRQTLIQLVLIGIKHLLGQ
ncbi:hypothetical protein [Paenibacillus sp. AN1007]|uniref:Uncharacterized protein n=1 Tax=Paenibacillus sp. AN1007 TaxID=3151385 RepID=A0AAU8NEJ8_9BACL